MSEPNEIQTHNPVSPAPESEGRYSALAMRPAPVYKPQYTSRYDDASWEVRVFLPGVTKDDVRVTVENEILEVHGVRHLSVPEGWRPLGDYPESKHYRLRLDVGPEVDPTGITASQSDGTLTLRLPLREEVKPRRIDVQ